MELNRNQFFLIGLLLLFIGIEFRLVQTFVLNEKATKVVSGQSANEGNSGRILPMAGPSAPRKSLTPPEWIGWLLASLGAVTILHSLAMPRPDGGGMG